MAITNVKVHFKKSLLSASSKALKVCCNKYEYELSFINLHKSCGRATPDELMMYKLALCLYKLYNTDFNTIEFINLNQNQILTSRQDSFKSLKNNIYKVGHNSLANRLHILNNKIPLKWLNLSMDSFKIHCKRLLLPL